MKKIKKDIYVIKNDINSKLYVGQAINSKERFWSHCKPSSIKDGCLIDKAIQKYGREHFWFEILESQIENYNEKEIYWISILKSIAPYGYNLLAGGENPPIYRGHESPSAILSEESVNKLTQELQNTMITFTDLAKKYNFASATSISEFNKGLTYVRDINYPIRKEILIGNGKLTSQDVEEIIKILQNTYRSYESIGKQYGVEARAISRINRGIFHYNKKLEYPIREGRLCSIPPKFSYEQVTDIISYLLNTNLSFSEIAKIFNAKYRDILDINNGETKLYRRKELNYPLRTKN